LTKPFGWINQHLMKGPLDGTSENAVNNQMENAISIYVLAAIA
jgi:hypothetical protein